MKTNKILFAAFALPVLLTSCLDDKQERNETIVEYKAYNMLYSEDSSEPEITPCNYFVMMDYVNSTMEIKSNNFFFNNTNCTFNAPAADFSFLTGKQLNVVDYKSPVGTLSGVSNVSVTDVKCNIASLLNITPTPIPGIVNISTELPSLFLSANLNNYKVKSFSVDTYYEGVTTTEFSFQGMPSAFQDENGSYRVILNIPNNKATVVIYNIKFAQQAPALTLVLEDLDVEFFNGYYTVSGENIVAKMLETGGLTSYEARPFTKFVLTTQTGALSNINIDFDVLDTKMNLTYKGQFTGSATGIED